MASITPDYEYIAAEKAGVIAMTVISVISFVCVSVTLLHILSVAVRPWFQKSQAKTDRSFLQRQTGVFIACLLFADFLQAVGGILQSRWAFEGGITDGALCNFQAIILMLGDNGAAVFSAVIATHTFIAIVLGKRFPRWVVILIVVLGWALTAFMALIGPLLLYRPNIGPFYGIAHSWCFATGSYAVDRVLLHCLPEFTSATIILLSYLLVWLSLRGHLVLSGESGWNLYRKPVARLNDLNAIANRMLWYPTVYIILVVPISVCRFITLDGEKIDSVAWTVSMCLLFSMGAADTVIYALTRNVGPTIPAKMIPSWISSRIGSTSGKHSRAISSTSGAKTWRSGATSEGGDTDFYDIHPTYSPNHKHSPSNMSPVTYSFQPLISPASATFSPASSVFPQHARNASINSNVIGASGSRNGSRVQVNVVTEKEILTDPPAAIVHPYSQFHR